jgi:Flp pilus assembly protein TadD
MTSESPEFFGFVLYYHAMIEARRGDLEEAVEKFSAAVAADPGNELEIAALREIAAAFTKAGSHALAADFYNQVVAKHPDDFSAWLALGTARHRAERFEEARSAYFRAIEVRPQSPVPWHNLGILASDLGSKQEARDYFKREVELAPQDAKAWYDFGVSLSKLGLEEESAKAFEQAEDLVKSLTRRSSDLSAALSIVRRLNLGERVLKTE